MSLPREWDNRTSLIVEPSDGRTFGVPRLGGNAASYNGYRYRQR